MLLDKLRVTPYVSIGDLSVFGWFPQKVCGNNVYETLRVNKIKKEN